MSKWVEYNPHTGLTEINEADENGVVTVHKMQDVEPLLDRNKSLANSGATNDGIKKGLWHYASIPPAVQYEMLTKHGINIQDRNHWPALFRLINTDYPYLKTTHKTHVMKDGTGKVYATPNVSRKLAS